MRSRRPSALGPPIWAAAVFIAAASTAALSYYAGVEGAFVDAAASESVSRALDLPVRLLEVRVDRWSDVRFGMMTLDNPGQKTLVACGPGRARFDGLPLVKGEERRVRLRFEEVAILEEVFKGSALISWASKQAFTDPIFVQRLDAVVRYDSESAEIHVTRFESEDITILGGVRFLAGRIAKANVLVLLPKNRFERVPKEIRARMIRRSDGRHGVRLVYAGGYLTVVGAKGPFFKVQWK